GWAILRRSGRIARRRPHRQFTVESHSSPKPSSMRLILLTLATAVLALNLGGCGNKARQQVGNAEQLYDLGKRASDNGNYRDAIRYYEQLEARFPFTNSARQSQLDLMYAYYKNREPEAAIDQADQF